MGECQGYQCVLSYWTGAASHYVLRHTNQDADQQPILPLGVAIEQLGLKVSWIGEICAVVHPCRGRLKVVLRRGCPEVSRELCLDLTKELEAAKSASYASPVQQARLQCSEQLSKVLATFPQLDQVKDRVQALRTWFREVFPDIPPELIPQVLPYPPDPMSPPPLNRHIRKRLRRGGGSLALVFRQADMES